jgi:hypothetical protein
MPIILATGLRHWKLVAGGLALAALAIALLLAKADARHWKKRADACQLRTEIAAREAAEATAANATRATRAADDFAARTAALQPLIVRSTNEVIRYAETPAGRGACLPADRVRGVDALDAALRAAAPASGGAGVVPADPGPPPAER